MTIAKMITGMIVTARFPMKVFMTFPFLDSAQHHAGCHGSQDMAARAVPGQWMAPEA